MMQAQRKHPKPRDLWLKDYHYKSASAFFGDDIDKDFPRLRLDAPLITSLVEAEKLAAWLAKAILWMKDHQGGAR